MTLMMDVVCDMVVCDDAVISDELNIQFRENGRFNLTIVGLYDTFTVKEKN